jgi:hypothetical protein
LERSEKELFIQVQDVSFEEKIINVPRYLIENPAFNGGVAMKYEFEDEDETRPIIDGWVARRWDPAVRERFTRLLRMLAREFDGHIAGLSLPETAIGFGDGGEFHPPGFSAGAYYHATKELMTSTRRLFRDSDVVIYANFMPVEELPNEDRGFLRGVYQHTDDIGFGVGGPDLLPHRWFQRQNSLPLIAGRAPKTVAGLAVQWGNLDDRNPATGKRVAVSELYQVARDEMRLDYIFWGTQEPYFSEGIIPFLNQLPVHKATTGAD